MRTVYLLCVISACFLAGCTQSYSVLVNGYSETTKPIPDNAHIYVFADPNSENTILDNQIKAKIVKFLADSNYLPVDDVGSEYRLAFKYGAFAQQELDYEYVGVGAGLNGYSRVTGIGTMRYVPTLRYEWSQWLKVRVYRGNTLVWLGRAEASQYYRDERQAVDYLVVALFSRFGRDTKRQEVITIKKDDPRLLELTASQ
jgi:hypothetical protein